MRTILILALTTSMVVGTVGAGAQPSRAVPPVPTVVPDISPTAAPTTTEAQLSPRGSAPRAVSFSTGALVTQDISKHLAIVSAALQARRHCRNPHASREFVANWLAHVGSLTSQTETCGSLSRL